MFEILTLSQTDKLEKKIPILICGSSYWNQVINLDMLAEKGAIANKDRELFQFVNTPEEAFHLLKQRLLENHPGLAAEAAREEIPATPAPSAQEILGPDIARTR
jgi:hypothetical protein